MDESRAIQREQRRATARRAVAVVGSGVVGTATGAGLQVKGLPVVFCDVAPDRLAHLAGRGFETVAPEDLWSVMAGTYLICVPTPTVDGRAELSHVRAATELVGQAMATQTGYSLVVVRSTVPPGTTESMVMPILEHASGRLAGRDFGLGMNPEFLRAASAAEDFLDPRVIVVGALDDRSGRALRHLYAAWESVPLFTTTLRTAEATKYVANLFNATKISFFNEMYRLFNVIGADADVAARAASLGAEGLWNPLYGTRGGSAFGGACLPKDAAAMYGLAEDLGIADLMHVLRATITVNEEFAAEAVAEGARVLLAEAEGR